MLQTLIDSAAKARLLEKMLERPGASFSVSGLGRLSDLSKASVSNIVSEWEKQGWCFQRMNNQGNSGTPAVKTHKFRHAEICVSINL